LQSSLLLKKHVVSSFIAKLYNYHIGLRIRRLQVRVLPGAFSLHCRQQIADNVYHYIGPFRLADIEDLLYFVLTS
jgi:hypothetical protein